MVRRPTRPRGWNATGWKPGQAGAAVVGVSVGTAASAGAVVASRAARAASAAGRRGVRVARPERSVAGSLGAASRDCCAHQHGMGTGRDPRAGTTTLDRVDDRLHGAVHRCGLCGRAAGALSCRAALRRYAGSLRGANGGQRNRDGDRRRRARPHWPGSVGAGGAATPATVAATPPRP